MLAQSNKKFKPALVGDNVLVRIPDVDRGRLAPRNVMAVVQSVDDGFYKLATKTGILQKLFCRNEFQLADNNVFIDNSNIDNKEISLRTASSDISGSTQGFISCMCNKKCINRACSCRKNNLLCNSKCHHSSSCSNK